MCTGVIHANINNYGIDLENDHEIDFNIDSEIDWKINTEESVKF